MILWVRPVRRRGQSPTRFAAPKGVDCRAARSRIAERIRQSRASKRSRPPSRFCYRHRNSGREGEASAPNTAPSAPDTDLPVRVMVAQLISMRTFGIGLFFCVLVGCGGPSLGQLASDLDELAVPDAWHLVATFTNGPGGDIECVPNLDSTTCPQLIRYYVASGSAEDTYAQGEKLLVDSGFTLAPFPGDPCDLSLSGRPTCLMNARAGERRLRLEVFSEPDKVPNVQISERSGPIVALAAWREKQN